MKMTVCKYVSMPTRPTQRDAVAALVEGRSCVKTNDGELFIEIAEIRDDEPELFNNLLDIITETEEVRNSLELTAADAFLLY